jgi:GR25 family glycosyltransferase involved in LPS biosynthesis
MSMSMSYEIYCLTYNNPKRKEDMTKKFKELKVKYTFVESMDFNDPKLKNIDNDQKKVFSCTFGHIKMLKEFYYNSTYDYGIFCEDDININRNFNNLMPLILIEFEKLKLDTLLLGYLINIKIPTNDNFHRLYFFDDNLWGAQMYLLSKTMIKHIIDKYDSGEYAEKTLKDNTMCPFSADYIITKQNYNTRMLIYPPIAIENGKSTLEHYGHCYDQYIFHMSCHLLFYNKEIYL